METSHLKTLVLPQQDVHSIVQHYGLDKIMDKLIHELSEAIRSYDPENIDIPIRSGFNYELPHPGLVEWMPLYKGQEEVVLKLVGYHPENPRIHNLPTILSTISSFDTRTGHLKAISDGVLLTSLRTGAASAVASVMLAKPDSKVLGLIGCGAQAVTQLHALSRVFDLQRVLIYDNNAESMDSFASRCQPLGLTLELVQTDMEQIVKSVDILCTATSIAPGEGPLFSEIATQPHLHINAVGSDFPGKVEVPLDFLKQAFVCPDFLGQAVIEGECQRLEASDIAVDWTKVAAKPQDFIPVKNSRSVFDSTGWALEDAVVMKLFTDYAQELGLGKEIQIEAIGGDAKSPYDFMQETLQAASIPVEN